MRLMCRLWVIVAGLFCSIVSTAFAEQAMPRDVLVLDNSGGAAVLDVGPSTGEETASYLAKAYASSAAAVEMARKLLEP